MSVCSRIPRSQLVEHLAGDEVSRAGLPRHLVVLEEYGVDPIDFLIERVAGRDIRGIPATRISCGGRGGEAGLVGVIPTVIVVGLAEDPEPEIQLLLAARLRLQAGAVADHVPPG